MVIKDTCCFLLGASSNCGTANSNCLRGICKKSKMKINKLGQMKIQQTAFMLLAVTLLFVLVAMFFIVFKLSGLKQSASDLAEQNALTLVSKVANYPELSCGNSFGGSMINCVDMDKVIFLLNNQEKYKELFGVSDIEIRKIYPKENEILCTLKNYPNCNLIKLINGNASGFDSSNFVVMCKKISINGLPQNKCELGKIIVKYNIK